VTRILSSDPAPPREGAATGAECLTGAPATPGPARGRWSNRRLTLVAAAVVATAVLLVWAVGFSPLFAVRHVRVMGASGAAGEQVRTAAQVADGAPLLRLDTAAISARVERVPVVASAHVDTSFPSTVTITVALRVAVGYLHVDGGYRLMDRTGTQFQTTAVAPRGLPELALPTGALAREAGAAVATVAAALPAALRAKVASIQAFDPAAITVLLRDDRVIHWGSAERSADKAAVVSALLTRPGRVFDVSNPDLVVSR
jgi:cell division protein FtsQ